MNAHTILPRVIMILLLVIFGGVVFHAPISVGLGTLFPDYDLLIKAWKEIIMLFVGALLVIDVTHKQRWREFVRDKLVLVCVAYALVHLVLIAPFWQGVTPTVMGLAIDLRFVLYFCLVYIALRLYPAWRRPFLFVGAGTALVSLLFAVLQVTVLPHDVLKYIGYGTDTIAPYLTVDKNYDFVRINGTLRGPNPLGAYALIVLAVVGAFVALGTKLVQSTRLRVVVCALVLPALVALWFSYSRSALVGAAVAVGLVAILTIGRKLPVWAWVAGCMTAGALTGLLAVSWHTPFVQNVILHTNPDGGSSISSNDEHFASLGEGTERLLSQPFGAGIGSTGSASLQGDNGIIIENQYLFVAHEVGWFGLVLFMVLFVLVLVRLWRERCDPLALGMLASGVGLSLIGILLPVWVDDTVSIVWWGLAAVAIAAPLRGTMKQNRNRNHARTHQ